MTSHPSRSHRHPNPTGSLVSTASTSYPDFSFRWLSDPWWRVAAPRAALPLAINLLVGMETPRAVVVAQGYDSPRVLTAEER